MLRPDPAQESRLTDIIDNLTARLAEAHEHGWFGEVDGLEVSLSAAKEKFAAMRRTSGRGPVRVAFIRNQRQPPSAYRLRQGRAILRTCKWTSQYRACGEEQEGSVDRTSLAATGKPQPVLGFPLQTRRHLLRLVRHRGARGRPFRSTSACQGASPGSAWPWSLLQ